jgi:hypothetical protein
MATQKTFTKQQIDDEIESVLADNSTQSITAQDLRNIIKDYVTASTSGPLLIYSGIIKSGEDAAATVIKDRYYNPDFFQKQNVNDPLDTDNIFYLNSVSMIGKANGTYEKAVPSTSGEGKIEYTVLNNVITSLDIIETPTGMIRGESFVLSSAFSNAVTYNGVIRPKDPNASFSYTYFELTENSDNTYKDHTSVNTSISLLGRGYAHIVTGPASGGFYADSLARFEWATSTYDEHDEEYDTTYHEQEIMLFRTPGTDQKRRDFDQ